MLLAGTFADLDWFSEAFGPAAFQKWHGGPLHSILGALLAALAISFAVRAYAKSRGVSLTGMLWWLAPVCAALLHVAMDALLSSGVQLFWPASSQRFALDWAPDIDLWLLILLLAGLFLPELFRLVGDEIGAKSKKPRGQAGAIIAFILIAAYFGARGVMHTSAVAMLRERSYMGESARRAAAFPDSTSPVLWHGVVETDSAIHLVLVPTGQFTKFDPEDALHIHKPEAPPFSMQLRGPKRQNSFLRLRAFPKLPCNAKPKASPLKFAT